VYGNAPVDVELANSILLHIPVDIKTITKIKGNWVNDVIIPEYVTTDFARLFGFLIGDGWVTDYVIGFAEGIYESQNILYKELMIKYFGSCVRRTGKNRVSQYGSYFTGSVLGIDLLKSLGFISGARNKRIPDWVYLAKNDIKMAFMQGLCDADGCDRSKQYSGKWAYTIGLANEKLIYDIKELWTSLGYSSGKIYTVNQPPTIIYGKDVKSFGGAWYINLSKTPINDFDSVTTIELLDDAECVYDIEVESNLHNFIANGIVVHNCIRPSNQLRMLEDAVVIYKLTRAPERRIFYIDVGNLPKAKADEYVRDVMQRYRNKVVYDGVSGEVHGDKKFSSMLEDYFMPRRGDSKGTQIDTLQGSNPGFTDMIDVEYFKRELYRSLNVPFSRLQSETGFNIGRASEISRDEVNFQKFIQRLQKKFSELFLQALETQLILKNVIGVGEFQQYTDYMYIEFLKDNYFEELKENEVLLGRIEAATDLQPFIGKYFSNTWVRKNIFKQTDEDMELMDEEIEEEFQNPIYYPPIMGDGSPMTGGMDGSTDGSIDGAGTGQSGGSGGQVVMTMADVQHTMSKTINQVAQGATIMIKRGGKPVAKLMPAGSNESVINESIQISKINNIQYLLETMKIDESILLNDVQTSIILKKLGN
jgi:antitoxin (DNA-binding transcriptional repressor) of toxin-antitoxin stability system